MSDFQAILLFLWFLFLVFIAIFWGWRGFYSLRQLEKNRKINVLANLNPISLYRFVNSYIPQNEKEEYTIKVLRKTHRVLPVIIFLFFISLLGVNLYFK